MASHAETREAILKTARAIFARQGVRKTTLDDIARAMHRTKTFIYHYFRNKDDLLRSLIEAEGDEYVGELQAAIAKETGARNRFHAYVRKRFEIFSRLGTFYGALREQYFEQYAFIEHARAKYDLFESETVSAIFAEGHKSGELDVPHAAVVAHAILVALKGFELEWATTEPQEFERATGALLSMLFDGIAAKARRKP